MAYSELVKNFNRIRDYMREFYIYGFKSREEYTKKSARSYDDERRRLESWLGDYMQFRQTPDGKNIFLSIDSRKSRHNPLYKAWKTKSFTDGDITLHFILMDIMASTDHAMSVGEIMEQIDEYLTSFTEPRLFDESTVRKKLKEYVAEGILVKEKRYARGYKQSQGSYFKESCDSAENYDYREKRCGTVEKIDNNTSLFYADVYDVSEMIPWIRTFISRITDIHFSDPVTEVQFKKDIEKMYKLYGLEGGETV